MAYEQTAAQKQYLKRMYARAVEEQTCCDCPTCDYISPTGKPCTGFVRNCRCDDNMANLRTARGLDVG